jgi:hypothetical protein
MELAAFLVAFALFFGAIMSFGIWFIWGKYRIISVAIPTGSDPQASRFKLSEVIRSIRYQETGEPGPSSTYRPPAWMKWAVGLQDIRVEPASMGAFLVTGPAFNVKLVGKSFAGTLPRPYQGPQPVGPLFKGFMRLFATGMVALAACGVTAYLVGVN